MSRTRLPIDDFIPTIQATVCQARAAVIVAAPGAGKTTRVPPALASDGPILVLQPRRIAARAIAARVADEQGWTLGEEVGWHVRFERRFSARTRVLFATEGILTARLLRDPLLSDFRTIVLDEFHERSVHADLGIALARQAWLARDDLRLVVMSATIEAQPVSAFLGGCPVIDVPGRTHPIAIDYAPGQSVADAVRDLLRTSPGSVLCFLPGAPEIQRALPDVLRAAPEAEVLPLHGSLDQAEQDRALRPSSGSAASAAAGGVSAGGASTNAGSGNAPSSNVLSSNPLSSSARSNSATADDAAGAARGGRRRVILATNIAETSLTVPGVTAVVDTGLHKVARYDGTRGIDSLELERVSQASADQRAGRAGRLAPGAARRLWSASDRLRPHREPDIMRIDLAAPLLDLLAWGGNPDTFEWFDAPPPEAVAAAWSLLRQLGAVDDRQLTALGRQLQAWPLHPRLGRILLASSASATAARDAARVCALLAERHFLPPRHELTTCDLFAAMDDWTRVPPHVRQVARQLEDLAAGAQGAAHGTAQRVAQSAASSGAESTVHTTPSAADTRQAAPAVKTRASETRHASGRSEDSSSPLSAGLSGEAALRRAILAGYPDRVARRREPSSARVLLASGHGAALSRESGVQEGEFLVALDVQAASTVSAGPAGAGGGALRVRPPMPGLDAAAAEARIRIASLVSRDWLRPTRTDMVHWFDNEAGRVKAARRELYEAIVLSEHPQAPDPAAAAPLLEEAYRARGPREEDQQLARRLAFADLPVTLATLVRRAATAGARAPSLEAMDLTAQLTWDESRELDRRAPETLRVPSGRTARLDYEEDGIVCASVKLQELFGLADTPRVGIAPRQAPVLLKLLAPNGRPVQTTRDLRSFWDRTYPEVRKELRGRYPKHPWPDDPWSATPTARTTRRPPRG